MSPYDGVSTALASDLDIDHVVPLKEAWVSGARDWTAARREAFANDLTRPQLVAVTDNLNQSKGTLLPSPSHLCRSLMRGVIPGDQDPAEWIPPLTSYRCTYFRAWVSRLSSHRHCIQAESFCVQVQVKYYYDLTVDSAEKSALTSYLASC